jgi:hypothetical protein
MACVETPDEVADLSSTGTSSSFTPEAHPANRATNSKLVNTFFFMNFLVN